MGVRSDGLVKANEEFAAWLTGERLMPFGENGEHVTIRLIDFADAEQNQYVVTTQYTLRAGPDVAGTTGDSRTSGPFFPFTSGFPFRMTSPRYDSSRVARSPRVRKRKSSGESSRKEVVTSPARNLG